MPLPVPLQVPIISNKEVDETKSKDDLVSGGNPTIQSNERRKNGREVKPKNDNQKLGTDKKSKEDPIDELIKLKEKPYESSLSEKAGPTTLTNQNGSIPESKDEGSK